MLRANRTKRLSNNTTSLEPIWIQLPPHSPSSSSTTSDNFPEQSWCSDAPQQNPLHNLHCFLKQRRGLYRPLLGTIQTRKVIQAVCRIKMIRPQSATGNPQRLCPTILPGNFIHHGEVVKRISILSTCLPMFDRELFQNILMQRYSLIQPPHLPKQASIGLLML